MKQLGAASAALDRELDVNYDPLIWVSHIRKNGRGPLIMGLIDPQGVWTKNIVHLV